MFMDVVKAMKIKELFESMPELTQTAHVRDRYFYKWEHQDGFSIILVPIPENLPEDAYNLYFYVNNNKHIEFEIWDFMEEVPTDFQEQLLFHLDILFQENKMYAIYGHTGDCSYDDYTVYATFDTREMAEQFVKRCIHPDHLIPDKEVWPFTSDIWPFRKDSLLGECVGVYIDEYLPPIPHNPSLYKCGARWRD